MDRKYKIELKYSIFYNYKKKSIDFKNKGGRYVILKKLKERGV